MPKILVDSELCKACLFCVEACPKKIIRRGETSNSKGYRFVEQFDVDKCNACKICGIVCPDSAIEVFK